MGGTGVPPVRSIVQAGRLHHLTCTTLLVLNLFDWSERVARFHAILISTRLALHRAARGRALDQRLPATARPADALGGHAHHQTVRGHILVHHGARADQRVRADLDAADDRAVGA